ncbi:MAG: NAD(P)H-binding protein [Verrucomicrobiales bacterium]|nr:NAD(P)H-binding protein [Verrucomicrobiales bacterium]
MKILVTTPTGKIGRRILAELLAPEFSVRVIVRDPARLPDEMREQVEVVRGSTDDAAVLRRALDGVESLFWCVPTESLRETNVRGHYQRFAHAASQAIRKTGTPRVVTISAVGKGLARKAGPFSGLHAMEDILNESGAAIRHLRCGFFMENFLWQARPICEQGFISYPMAGHIPIPMAAGTDIADAALKWLVRRDWKGIAGCAVHGPEDLSFNQAATVLERILERPVRYRPATANDYARILFGSQASTKYARCPIEMFAELAQDITRAEPRTAESTTPTTLAAWAKSELVTSLRPQPKTAAAPAPGLREVIHQKRHHEFGRDDCAIDQTIGAC